MTASDPASSSPGAILKRCREYHGISLKEAAEGTKVGENYLAALESDRVSEFANLAYLKGFLRIYATFLGLNPDDIMRMYDKLYPAAAREGAGPVPGSGHREAPGGRPIAWQRFLLPAVLLALILITSAIINRGTPSAPPRTAPAAPPQTVQQPGQAVQPVRSGARLMPKKSLDVPPAEEKSESPASPEQQPAAPLSPERQKGFIVRMKVSQGGSLSATIDGSAPQHYELSTGDIIEWKAEKKVFLDLSNAGGVEAELNGKPLRALGPAGQPASVTIDADGIRP